jgi:WD40 repeat protein
VIDITTGAEIQKLNTKVCKRMDVTDDNTYAAIIGMYKEVQIWNLTNLQIESTLMGHTKSDGMEVKFSKDGTLLATTNGDKTCIIWDMKTKKMIKQLNLSDFSETVAFSPDSKWLTIITNDHKVFVYKIV